MYNPARVKEEAEELVDKMLYCYQGHIDEYTAKQCALVAVDKLIYYSQAHGLPVLTKFYEEVKQKIINYGKVTI